MRIIRMIVLFFIFSSAVCFAGEKSFEEQVKEHEEFAKNFGGSTLQKMIEDQNILLPQEKDKQFIRQNKEKYNFLDEKDILDISKDNFDNKVSSGEIKDPNSINHRNLNQASTELSLKKDDASRDKSKTTPNEYLDIAVKAEEDQRKNKKDLEETQIKEAINIVDNPTKVLKEEFGMDSDCKEEEGDVQDFLTPKIKTYKVGTKSKETIEEHKTCEESEPVTFQCERKLSLSCSKKEKLIKEDPNKRDWSEELERAREKHWSDTVAATQRFTDRDSVESGRMLARLLSDRGMCVENILKWVPKIVGLRCEEYKTDVGCKHKRDEVLEYVKQLKDHPCEIPQEGCVKWKEIWENKCERELKKF